MLEKLAASKNVGNCSLIQTINIMKLYDYEVATGFKFIVHPSNHHNSIVWYQMSRSTTAETVTDAGEIRQKSRPEL